MQATGSGIIKHRQLHFEDYLQRVSAEQKEYAEVCASPKMAETVIFRKQSVPKFNLPARSRILAPSRKDCCLEIQN